MQRFELLLGSEAFWASAERDIAAARRRVLVQAMTFEGDTAGLKVAAAIGASGAADRRVIVDDYTRHVINDTFLRRTRDPVILGEAEATWGMFDRLCTSGTQVRVSNPIGSNPLSYPLRNHKKLLVMDDVAWLGGINFSDHNFAWHDLMLRIDDREIAEWLTQQFEADWAGQPAMSEQSFANGTHILSFDGIANRKSFAPLLNLFAEAQRSVEVISAYPTFPFVDSLGRAAARGADVTLYTPEPNNKPIIRDYLLHARGRSGINIRLLPEMTHVKAALVDGHSLVLGSSNFDFVSYRTSNEFVILLRDEQVISEAISRLFLPARSQSSEAGSAQSSGLRGLRAGIALRAADALIARLGHGQRIMEWQRP